MQRCPSILFLYLIVFLGFQAHCISRHHYACARFQLVVVVMWRTAALLSHPPSHPHVPCMQIEALLKSNVLTGESWRRDAAKLRVWALRWGGAAVLTVLPSAPLCCLLSIHRVALLFALNPQGGQLPQHTSPTSLCSHVCVTPHIGAGDVDGVLAIMAPALVAAAPHCTTPAAAAALGQTQGPSQTPSAATGAPSGVAVAFLRVCSATLALVGAAGSSGGSASLTPAVAELLACVSRQCEAAVAATVTASSAGASQQAECNSAVQVFCPTDFADPMASVALREAAKLWLGIAAECEAAVTAAGCDSESSGGLMGLVGARLAACLKSASYDVRAAACKASVSTLREIASRLGLSQQHVGGLSSNASKGRVTSDVTAPAAATTARWVEIMAGVTAGGAAAAAAQLPGVGGAPSQLAPAALQAAVTLEGVLWAHTPNEPVAKVVKRALRALCALDDLTATAAVTAGAATILTGSMGRVTAAGAMLAKARGVEERSEALRVLGHALGRHGGVTGAVTDGKEQVQLLSTFVSEVGGVRSIT